MIEFLLITDFFLCFKFQNIGVPGIAEGRIIIAHFIHHIIDHFTDHFPVLAMRLASLSLISPSPGFRDGETGPERCGPPCLGSASKRWRQDLNPDLLTTNPVFFSVLLVFRALF